MACRFEITLASQDVAGVPHARGALDEIDRLEAQLSVFREDERHQLRQPSGRLRCGRDRRADLRFAGALRHPPRYRRRV